MTEKLQDKGLVWPSVQEEEVKAGLLLTSVLGLSWCMQQFCEIYRSWGFCIKNMLEVSCKH